MDALNQARREIDRIDGEMALLFTERMKAAEVIADYKKENGLPVEDKARENAMIRQLSQQIPEEYRPYYIAFLNGMIGESKKYQSMLMGKMKVAYSGVEGAFAHIAARRLFPTAETAAFESFEEAYRAVDEGRCHAAVLPIENSFAGDVGQVMDLAYRGSLTVRNIYEMPLSQSLLVKPGTEEEEIREVKSHPQALAQCMPFLKKKGWTLTQAANTAAAARELAEGERRDMAVLAAREAAGLYGLKVLRDAVNQKSGNTTRFAVFCRGEIRPEERHRHFALMFNCKNEPGSLEKAISVIGNNGFNLRCLKSHPTGEENWAYYFYAEGDGELASPEGQVMRSQLTKVCDRVKLLASFENYASPEERED